MFKITIVVGNPKPNSRTGRIAEMLVESVFGSTAYDLKTIDLANHSDELFKWPSEQMADLNRRVAESHLAIFASPTYKASYTGLLKSFLDRYPANGLKNVTAVALMTGADWSHSMTPTVQLIPLLLELGAIVPVRGLFFNMAKMDQAESIVSGFADELTDAFRTLLPVVLAAGSKSCEDARKSCAQAKAS